MTTFLSSDRRIKSERHLKYIRTLPCLVCGSPSTEAHHLLKPWQGGRGMGMKSGDQNTVPLCHTHHMELHNAGDEDFYFERYLGEQRAGRLKAMQFWFASPAYKENT